MNDMTPRERDTILAALRVYQQALEMNGGKPPADVNDIARNSGKPLTAEEIDELCPRINSMAVAGPEQAPKARPRR